LVQVARQAQIAVQVVLTLFLVVLPQQVVAVAVEDH
jgi:hypothetical protein